MWGLEVLPRCLAWRLVNDPVTASSGWAAVLDRARRRANAPSVFGLRWPATSASIIARPDAPNGSRSTGVLEQLLHRLPLPAAVADQRTAIPGQVTHLADRFRVHQRRAQHPTLGQFRQPDR